MSLAQTTYSDDYIAAIWLCDKLVTDRQRILNGFKKRIGDLPKEIRDVIIKNDFFDYRQKYVSKAAENAVIEEFFLKIFKGEIKPEDENLQKISVFFLKAHLVSNTNLMLTKELKQQIGNKAVYFRQLGYDISYTRIREFTSKMLHQIVDEILA